MDQNLADRLAQMVRGADPDRYFATLFAPPDARPYLFALYAFHAEVARIAENVREPMLGAIRLEWWRETVEGAAHGAPRNHDVAQGLAALFAERAITPAPFESLIAARAFDHAHDMLSDMTAFTAYVDSTSVALMRLAALILGSDPHASADVTHHAGLAYGMAGLIRALPFHAARHKLYLPLDVLKEHDLTPQDVFHMEHADPRLIAVLRQIGLLARDHFRQARLHRPGVALAAILPAALVPVYLRRMTREVPIHRRQMALLSAAVKRRL